MKTLAHLSDLHLGRDAYTRQRVRALAETLSAEGVDHVVVTGNLTWTGRLAELVCFQRLFAAVDQSHRLTIVPGTHDRRGDNLVHAIQPGGAVSAVAADGLYLIRFDSTGPHGITVPRARGGMTDGDVAAILSAVEAAPAGKLVVVLMHHPILALLPEHDPERLLSWLNRSCEQELERGRRLLGGLHGRCDLLMHGHEEAPRSVIPFGDSNRPLSVLGAGSSPALGRVRVFRHEGGRLMGPPAWLEVDQSAVARPLPRPHLSDLHLLSRL